ncbi:MAG: radical SAM protein [Methanomassiliicoccus sp.]|nr:radical SAM protein [Methanomassiliicoccus sp.]
MSDLDAFMEDGGGPKIIKKECYTALSPSRLPGLDLALNPYTQCAHACTYCYAPYLMRVDPLEWGAAVQAKINIPRLLSRELMRKKGVVGLGTVTDPYQPVEAELQLTRRCLDEMVRAGSSVSLLTKSDLVIRDIDLLRKMASAEVGITINTCEDARAAVFESGAPPPSRRLKAVRALVDAEIGTYIFLGPVIPTITDHDLDGLVNSLIETRVRSVMIDRLNLRPGMKERMSAVMRERSSSTLDEFELEVDNDRFYNDIITYLKRSLTDGGIVVIDAF